MLARQSRMIDLYGRNKTKKAEMTYFNRGPS